MKKFFYLSVFLFSVLALTGGSCLSGGWGGPSRWFGGGSSIDQVDTFDLFDDAMLEQEDECDAIEQEYDVAATAGEDQSVLDEIVKRHLTCLATR